MSWLNHCQGVDGSLGHNLLLRVTSTSLLLRLRGHCLPHARLNTAIMLGVAVRVHLAVPYLRLIPPECTFLLVLASLRVIEYAVGGE